jgi:hypothetical protein
VAVLSSQASDRQASLERKIDIRVAVFLDARLKLTVAYERRDRITQVITGFGLGG